MLFYLKQKIDEKSKTDLTLYRSAFENINQLGEFGRCKFKFGIDFAMPLFKRIQFNWADHSVNPIGDIMSSSIFSPAAVSVIKSLNCKIDMIEAIEIEGVKAVYILLPTLDFISDDLDMFESKKLKRRVVVSQRFKDAWESAGLLGAEFEAIPEDDTKMFAGDSCAPH